MRYKICPICNTPAPEQAKECSACGASLQGVAVIDQYEQSSSTQPKNYDFHYGETDLVESQLKWRGGSYILGGTLLLAVLVCGGVTLFGASRLMAFLGVGTSVESITTQTAVATMANAVDLVTNTAQPTLFLPTVTADAPPTRTVTPSPAPTETPGPCMQQVQSGDSLIALVSRCGHKDLDVIDLVLDLNNLSSAEVIQVGQTLEIPWPTATPGPNLEVTEGVEPAGDEASSAAAVVAVADEDFTGIIAVPTATLQPGVMWHRIVRNENVISIAFQYGANVKILSELNPEIAFSQCDFGEFGGGPSCVVNLIEGQQIRVPAPTPTPTLSVTPSGSETPTPTATPTFNAPSARSPGDRALFRRQELVTLRWAASASLAEGQVYRVDVEDITTSTPYSMDTTELFLIVPVEWQGRDSRRHEYRWTVSVVDADVPNDPHYTTEPRIFVWEGTAEE